MASSIGSDTNDAQAVRDFYKEREKTLKEQHRKEIAKIQEAHRTNINEANTITDERFARSRDELQSTLQRQDLRHQKEINKLRQAHAAQKRRDSVQRSREEEYLQQTYEDQIRQKDKAHRVQLQSQKEKSRQTLQGNNFETGVVLRDYQQRFQEDNGIARDRMNRLHQSEKRQMQIRHQDEVDSLRAKNQESKLDRDRQIAEMERKHRAEMQSMERRHKITLQDLQRQNSETLRDLQNQHQYSVDKVQQRYNEALAREKEQLDSSREQMMSQTGRVAQERDRQNQRIRNLQGDNVRDLAQADRQKRIELDNLREADHHANTTLEEANRNRHQAILKEHGEELRMAEKNADQRVQQNYEYFQKRMEKEDEHNNRILTDQRRKLIRENNDKRKANEMHMEQIVDNYNNDLEKMLIAHKNEKIRLQDRYQQNLGELRFQDGTERETMRKSFNEKIAEMDLKHKNELMDLQQKHEQQIIKMRDQQQQLIVDLKREAERVQMDRDQANKMREMNREAKFRHQVENMQKQHAEQIANLNKNYRHNLARMTREAQRIEKGKD